MIRLRTFALAFAAFFLSAAPAFAHAMLLRAEPAVGAKNVEPPARILLVFSEGVEPLLSEIVLTRDDGAAVMLGAPHSDGSKDRLAAAVETALAPGRYRVSWRVVSVDGHKTEGDFSFTVGAEDVP